MAEQESESKVREVADRLVELCRQRANLQAIDELYSDDVTSVEGMAMPGAEQRTRGKEKVREGNQIWNDHHELHAWHVDGPFCCGGERRFLVRHHFDLTPRGGERLQFTEVAEYRLDGDGKVVEEFFFYRKDGAAGAD
ncbi:MAG: SnoaL-like domain-containing protein [Acidobacteriota bacterium]